MSNKIFWSLLVTLACLCGASNLAAKTTAVDGGFYTTKDAEFYLTPEQLLFIRPGLEVEILDVVIPADTQLEVTYRLSDSAGLGLDVDGVTTPGPIDTIRHSLTYIPQGEEKKVVLAGFLYDTGGTMTALGDGKYMYKFATVLGDNENYDPDATHTLAIHARRDLTEFDFDYYVDDVIYNFVPSGASNPMPRDIVTTDTCNRCHDPIGMHASHGGPWVEVQWCTQCHNQTTDMWSENLRFERLIHKVHAAQMFDDFDFSEVTYPAPLNACEVCHTGGMPTENFPMIATPVAAMVCDASGLGETTLSWEYSGDVEIHVRTPSNPAGKLFARGGREGTASTGKWVRDGTVFDLYDAGTMELIQSVTVNANVLGCLSNMPGLPVGMAGEQHTNWMDHPSRAVCGSCHADIDFEAGEGHPVQKDDESCHFCHKPVSGAEFDLSVAGAHTEVYKSAQLPGIVIEILSITDTNPGDNPTVTFSMTSEKGRVKPSELAFFNLIIAGPNEDFSFFNSEFAVFGAVPAADGNWAYTFNTPLPDDAAGSYTAGAEAFTMVPLKMGNETNMVRHTAENYAYTFAVTDDAPMARRMVVDDDKCESCHSNLALHGTIRHDAQYCATCHYPAATDHEELQEGAEEQSIHFKYMVHKIHRGEDLEYGYVVAGHNQSVHDYSHVVYPGDLRNCDACHVNDSQQVPLPAGLLETTTPQEWWDPMMPVASACISCHDSDSAAAHIFTNTTFFGESCATCHGEGKAASVDKVHAR